VGKCVYFCGNAFQKIIIWLGLGHDMTLIKYILDNSLGVYLHENVYNVMEHGINSCFCMNCTLQHVLYVI